MRARSIWRAAFWMAGWLSATLLMTIGGRELAVELPVFVVMLLRCVIALGLLMPVVAWRGVEVLRTGRFGLYVSRNLVHYSAQFCWFYALSLIPIARVVSIEFTMPIWTAILAALFLGERLSGSRLGAIALGFLGILVIVRPGLAPVGWGESAALYAAVMFAVAMVFTKSLTRTDSAFTITFYMFAIQAVIGFAPAFSAWMWPPAHLWPWIFVVGVAGTVSHYCLARAMAAADATVVIPMDFLRVPLTAFLGWLIYGESVDIDLALGAALILAGNFLNLRQRAP